MEKNLGKGWGNLPKSCHRRNNTNKETTMKYLTWLLCASLALVHFYGCRTSQIDEVSVKSITFGVVNKFPDHPNYLKEKTLVAMHRNTTIESLSVKEPLTRMVEKFLVARGYRVIEVAGREALKDGRADRVIEIVPRKVFKTEGTFGYGFADRKFLLGLINNKPYSYVSMELLLSRKNSMRIITTKKEERFSNIGIETMPDEWRQLTEIEKKLFEENLQENMAKAMDILLSRLKI
jgi:hypothetical protein